MINIQVQSEGIKQLQNLLTHMPGALNKAQRAALSRTLQFMKTTAAKLGSEKYYAKSSEIKQSITTKKGNDYGAIISRGQRKSIVNYYVTPKQPNKSRKTQIRGAVKRNGIKSLGKAFFIRLGGKYYPYYRVGRGRWDIKRIISPAIPQILANDEITEKLSAEALKKYNERLNHEIMRQLGIYK